MKNKPYDKNKAKKRANIKKYRQKDRKSLPKIMLLIPMALAGTYLILTNEEVAAMSIRAIIAAFIFFTAYGILSLIWYIKYRRMLQGATMKQIDQMSGVEFEDYLALLYRKKTENGEKLFSSVETTPKTLDYGADLLLRTRDGRKAVVQAKRYRQKVPESAVQQLIAAKEYYRGDVGIVITNSLYTDAAKTLAKKCNIILIDRYKLGTNAMYHF